MEAEATRAVSDVLRSVSPGRPLREGIDRILQAHMGALLIIGDGPEVLSICSGGFLIDAEFTPQKLFELAKMDGAIVLSKDSARIARANVHLVPDPRLPTNETGTRHRTAERVARSVDIPVIAVSEELSVITIYRNEIKHPLQSIPILLDRAGQALSTLERYKGRLDVVFSVLDGLEVRDEVTFKDLLIVLQRAEMVRRISEEVTGYIVELGSDGRLLALQYDELARGFDSEYRAVLADFLGVCGSLEETEEMLEYLAALTTDEILDLELLANGVKDRSGCAELKPNLEEVSSQLGLQLSSKGSRMLARVPRLPREVRETILSKFACFKDIVDSDVETLGQLEGVGANWAKAVKNFLSSI